MNRSRNLVAGCLFICFAGVANAQHVIKSQDVAKLLSFSSSQLTAKPGDFALCPSWQFVDEALEKGADSASFIYYAAKIQKVGATETEIRTLAGTEATLPNELIIPIPKGQTAKPGEIILTWWQSGSGMQRAIVVGGEPTKPIVRYLDVDYDSIIGLGKKDETLAPGTFVALKNPLQPGTTAVAEADGRMKVGHVLKSSADKVLLKFWGGKPKAFSRKLVQPIAIYPDVKAGYKVKIALYGSLSDAVVKSVDPKIGRVFVEYEFGGSAKEGVLAFGDVVK